VAALVTVIAVLLGCLSSLIFWSLFMGARQEAKDLQTRLTDVLNELTATRGGASEVNARLEQVITQLKAEVMSLEKDLSACRRDPAVLRDRLRRLLGDAEADLSGGGGVSTAGLGALSHDTTPK